MSATLHEVPTATLQDIPRVFRAIADEIEAGQHGKVHMAAIVIESDDGTVRTFGAGGADYYRGMALFHLGIENLLAKRGREFMA
ncbi:MAG: hypothetical protein HY855_02875 [Burkholderiales bacterium]|nr:hypothetical protein [Burkholderiales bacterium]